MRFVITPVICACLPYAQMMMAVLISSPESGSELFYLFWHS